MCCWCTDYHIWWLELVTAKKQCDCSLEVEKMEHVCESLAPKAPILQKLTSKVQFSSTWLILGGWVSGLGGTGVMSVLQNGVFFPRFQKS